ncbi:MAG: nitrous oxide reductase accessory protein NosL [Deltaproteobacteria bacterium]|nr:nitrous oxide reductase accessory protein NosL [Deltaproteobacteria bacterium]
MKRDRFLHGLLALLLSAATVAPGWAAPLDKAGSSERCVVCGMFVAKYPNWVTQLLDKTGKVRFFDGVKDLMAFYFAPASFGADGKLTAVEIWVKDYYTLEWLDGRQAFYVVGSDIYGPMGEEFIPFTDRAAADNFLKDHHGSRVLTFDEITAEMVESMRGMHKMKGPMAK